MIANKALVSDFDGTITQTDFYTLIADRYMRNDPTDYFEEYRQGRLTHVQAMQGFFQHAPGDMAALEVLMRDTEPDPDLAQACERLAQHGWDLIIVSAGSTWYIERILAKLGVKATLHSNPGRIVDGRGLQLDPPVESPFYDEHVGIDKAAVVRDALTRYEDVAFAGDGPPDLPPALLVPDDRRFAKGWLAAELTRMHQPYHPFLSWATIVEELLS